ncbi:L-tyrosine/L-tryptophan isonitrile synthase family protein [Actinacidiphila acididurans]|uniref:L-tyrosine/L-tryptophan isonitrile synthase family protein n=1 Tax=Actinacidiphila acididurans TaxID=2784346 RepID=A0ABS2U142_9ACTN|nr:L-tyrosine/L-tryptophan isonitrile synthase family protein [Actinacidiphila acididurans]MBM9508921.1 L-tyrosine/L-tryptophan isonitrile synthase family protein [Actinacidiphila acididurans]
MPEYAGPVEATADPRHLRTAQSVFELLMKHRRTSPALVSCDGVTCADCRDAHLPRLLEYVAAGRPIELVLPAFPGKSPNTRKVLGVVPDLAEELALTFLVSLCRRVKEVHEPGARVVICSDGRVFSDMVRIPDAAITDYQAGMRTLIGRIGDDELALVNLDDFYDGADHDAMRRLLEEKYAEPLDVLRAEVRAGGPALELYRGITRFLYEDGQGPGYTGSKAALQRDARRRAYGVIQRSQAWGNLLAERFPAAVRLSIHPQPCGSRKLGINLMETTDSWLTPWHGVAVERDGRHHLMKRHEAERQQARLVLRDGRPSHYVLPAAPVPTDRPEGSPSTMTDTTHTTHPVTPAPDAPYDVTALHPFGVLVTAHSACTRVTDLPVADLRDLVREHRIMTLRGFTTFTGTEDYEGFAGRWGDLMAWPFGTILNLVEHDDPQDSVFGNGFLPFHWDGMYVGHIPEFQMFHCLEAPDTQDGGRTLFADTTAMLEAADPAVRELWERATVTYRINKTEHYGGVAVSPVVVPHPRTGTATVRFNEPMPEGTVNRSALAIDGVDAADERRLLASLEEALRDPRSTYAHAWQPDDIVVTDNYTLLHTREPFRSKAPRHLRRIHILGDPPLVNPAIPAETA